MAVETEAPKQEATQAQALDAIFARFNRGDAPGLVVGVAYQGKTIYRRGFGMASLEHAVTNSPATRMSLGSSAKHMTALAALLLAEEGKLDIDKGVRSYLPELPQQDAEPTLRQWMTHTSGSRCYLDLSFLCDGLAVKPKGYALAAQVRQAEANFAPGDQMLYCNGGYHLLAIVIERVSGMEFGEFLRRRIFEPLGMADTAPVASDFELHTGMATQHVLQADGTYRRGIFPSEEMRGDGAVISTVDDMLRWLAHMRGPRTVGSENSWEQMFAHTRLNNGSISQYGLGLVRAPYRGVEAVHHAGGVIGGLCQMLTVPEHALDIIIMTNGAAIDPSELANEVIDLVLGDATLQGRPDVSLARTAQFAALAGRRYHSASGMLVGFGDSEGKLAFSMLGNYLMPLTETADELRIDYADAGVGPFAVRVDRAACAAGAPQFLDIAECGHVERFELVPEHAPDALAAGAELAGHYYCPDMNAHARVAVVDQQLQVRITDGFGASVMALEPLKPDLFLWKMAPPMMAIPGALNVVRENGRVTGYRLDAARSRHVLFRRVGSA